MFKGITLPDFNELFQSDGDCLQYLFTYKWRHGYTCKKCGHQRFGKGRTTFHARCLKCRHDESVTAHTIFHQMHFSMLTAFSITFQIAVLKNGASTVDLARFYGVNQKTAWLFKRKVQEAMGLRVSLDEFEVEIKKFQKIDSVILMHRAKNLNGLQRVNVQIHQGRSGKAGVTAIRCFGSLSSTTEIEQCQLAAGHFISEGKNLTIWNLKNWLSGTHRHCSDKYLSGYLNEYFFRHNRRSNEDLIWHHLIECMIDSKPYSPYSKAAQMDRRSVTGLNDKGSI